MGADRKGLRHINQVLESTLDQIAQQQFAAADPDQLSPEFIRAMELASSRVRGGWEAIEEIYELDGNAAFWLQLNALLIVAAERRVPPASIDSYLRHMLEHRHSLLNLYRNHLKDQSHV